MWRQLRWRLVGAQMFVVLVGVTALAVAAQLSLRSLSPQIYEALIMLAPDADEGTLAAVAAAVTRTMQRVLLRSSAVAAIAAAIAGLLTSILLMREIVRPLSHIIRSSRRIANGHYDQRVALPSSDELALVAVNFNQMAESLAQVEEQRVQMIGNVAHELRTPLTGLRGYLEGLLDGLFPPNNETFGHMYQEVRRLQRLVDDLQALSRVEAGQFELHVREFDLLAVVERVTNQVRPQVDVEELTLTVNLPDAPLLVYADMDRTAQVIINLLGNAIRYTEPGDAISVGIQAGDRFAQIYVSDTGAGLTPENQIHIFDRFYRADPSRTQGGSGIGLTIARHFAWAMGGDLSVQSKGLGQGSTFTLRLPLA